MRICDGCGKSRRDVRSVGRDANGDPDAPDLCFVCRKEASRGRTFDDATGRYHTPPLVAPPEDDDGADAIDKWARVREVEDADEARD